MVGIGVGMGPAPRLADTYDPQSRKHVQQGTYPHESDVTRELDALAAALVAHGVQVKRPESLGFNQVFARDIGVVIDGAFVMTSMVEDRAQEQAGIDRMLEGNPGTVHRPRNVRLEGGDIMPMPGEIWVGCADDDDFSTYTTARTNLKERNGSVLCSRTVKSEYLSCRNPTVTPNATLCTSTAALLHWAWATCWCTPRDSSVKNNSVPCSTGTIVRACVS